MMQRAWLGLGLCWTMACGGTTANQPVAEASTAPSATVATAPTPVAEEPPALANEEVVGLWCEYWAAPPAGAQAEGPSRGADTQQYLFLDDGRFGWRAESAAGQEPQHRAGQWRVVGHAIVLTDSSGQAIDQLAIADCPPNPEAEQLDTRYRCRSLGGKAFWLRKAPDQVDASQYIQ